MNIRVRELNEIFLESEKSTDYETGGCRKRAYLEIGLFSISTLNYIHQNDFWMGDCVKVVRSFKN